jgi:lysophospholipase L1-like esterase
MTTPQELVRISMLMLGVSVAFALSPSGAQEAGTPVNAADRPVVILGASYAGGWNPSVPGVRFVNKGVTGQQTFEMLARFEQDVVSQTPRAVIIWGFINDVFRTPPEQLDKGMARARESIVQMAAMSRARRIEPILATEITLRPRDNTWSEYFAGWAGWLLRRRSYQDFINGYVLTANEWMRTYAKDEGILLLDFQPVVSDKNNYRQKAYAASDGSHVSPEGYRALTAYAAPILQKHFSP